MRTLFSGYLHLCCSQKQVRAGNLTLPGHPRSSRNRSAYPFRNNRYTGLDDVKQFPSVAELQGAWTAASHALRDRFDAITAAELDAPITSPFPLR